LQKEPVAYVPGLQAVQALDPTKAAVCPAEQFMQSDAPVTFWKVWMGHEVQVAAPDDDANVPIGHGWQSDWFVAE
jgi:hypothetical protein